MHRYSCTNNLFDVIFSVFLVKKAIEDAKLEKKSIDEIVLVGGSTRIPKIREMMKRNFPGTHINFTINPDEAIACGAAIQAAILREGLKPL